MLTPLPAARPSAFTTTGYTSCCSTYSVASASSVNVRCAAVGTLFLSITCLAKSLLPSRRAAVFDGTEDPQSLVLEAVHDAGDERRLRTDDRQVDVALLREVRQALEVARQQVRTTLGDRRDAAVAGRTEDRVHLGALRERHAQGVLPAAATDHQHLHDRSPPRTPTLPREARGRNPGPAGTDTRTHGGAGRQNGDRIRPRRRNSGLFPRGAGPKESRLRSRRDGVGQIVRTRGVGTRLLARCGRFGTLDVASSRRQAVTQRPPGGGST